MNREIKPGFVSVPLTVTAGMMVLWGAKELAPFMTDHPMVMGLTFVALLATATFFLNRSYRAESSRRQ